MSLYNMLHGMTPAVFFVAPMLGRRPDEYPRFRDCFLSDPEHPRYDDHIHIYTRVGGGNRDDYEEQIEWMRHLPHYVTDFDDSFDSTFATFVFSVPPEYAEDFKLFKEGRMREFSEGYKAKLYELFPKLKEKLDELFGAEATA